MEQPSKFINHEVADTLDSSHAFEGPEKLLELWFQPSEQPQASEPTNTTNESRGLLAVPRPVWETVLDLVHCKVLSVLSYENVDSYVLSESSFFVYPQRLILKTCGTTTLLDGLPRLMEIVKTHVPELQSQPARIFYSRRSFMFPDRQLHPHKSWNDETAVLQKMFPNGHAMTFGPDSDRWYLFSYIDQETGALGPENDQSLEMMMTELNPAAAAKFSFSGQGWPCSPPQSPLHSCVESAMDSIAESATESVTESIAESVASSVGCEPDDDDPGHHYGNILTRLTNIDEIYHTKNQTIDSFAFSPCGYSCNGIVDAERYFNIHVTPEAGFSYASFETNVPPQSFGMTHTDVIARSCAIFQPAKFSVVLFQEGKSLTGIEGLPGYECTCRVSHTIGKYDMCFLAFRRK